MTSEEELINMIACREVFRSFSLSETEVSVEPMSPHPSWEFNAPAGSCRRCSRNGTTSRCQNAECGANYWRGAGPQGTSGRSLTNAAPINGEGGRTGEGTEETQQFNGQASGHIKNISWEPSAAVSPNFTTP